MYAFGQVTDGIKLIDYLSEGTYKGQGNKRQASLRVKEESVSIHTILVSGPEEPPSAVSEKKESPASNKKRMVMDNEGGASLVFKASMGEILGMAEVGAEVRYVTDAKERPSGLPFVDLVHVEFLSGRLAGQKGWVNPRSIKLID